MSAATKTKAAPSRAVNRAPEAQRAEPAQRGVEREPAVPKDRVVALGRDGKPIWRKSFAEGDRFFVDPAIIPDGWVYEWKRKSIFGQEDVTHQVSLRRNGWSDVPAERHPGIWMPVNHKGSIEVDGQILMEIPAPLYHEAQREDKKRADVAVRGSRQAMGMGFSAPVADASHPSARRASFARSEAPTPVLNQNKYEYSLDD